MARLVLTLLEGIARIIRRAMGGRRRLSLDVEPARGRASRRRDKAHEETPGWRAAEGLPPPERQVSPRRTALQTVLRDHTQLRRAIVLKEILDRPVALRRRR